MNSADFVVSRDVQFMYHGTMRKGEIVHVGNTYINLLQEDGHYKSYRFDKMSLVTFYSNVVAA